MAELQARAEGAREIDRRRLLKKGSDAIIRRISDFIISRAAGSEACTKDHLIAAGFLHEDLAAHLPAALHRAAKQAPGLVGGD